MSSVANRLIALPQGRRLLVFSDLQLNPELDAAHPAVTTIVSQLNEIDESTVVILAGSTFLFTSTSDPKRFIDATWRRLPQLQAALRRIAAMEHGQVILIPGEHDVELAEDLNAQATLERDGLRVAASVSIDVMTWRNNRRLEVVAGSTLRHIELVDEQERSDAGRLDDTQALTRFVQSRLMYRRFGRWVWLPLWIFGFLILSSIAVGLFDQTGANGSSIWGRTPHFTTWGWVSATLFGVATAEAVLVSIASAIARRKFFRRGEHEFMSSEPLGDVVVDQLDALSLASRIVTSGGAGLIVGGCARPALAFLDKGVCAAPGPSGRVYVERRGRLGLPPVFQPVARTTYVEVEAGSSVRVRLVSGGVREKSSTRLERWLAGRPALPAPPEAPALVGSWPDGDPWPQTPIRQLEFRRALRIKRVVSGVVFFTGLANIVSAIVPPARGRLDQLLHILPLGVAQSAAAATALSGTGMIMMARGLRRGQRRAWMVATALFVVSTTTHVLHSGSLIGTVINVFVVILLLTERRIFQGATDRGSFSTALPKLLAIPSLAVTSATVVVIATSRIPFGHRWMQIIQACIERLIGINRLPLPDRAGDFLSPSLFATGIIVITGGLYLLTRPVVDRRLSHHGSSTERRIAELRARDIVRRHGRGTLDYFALRDDKQFFFFRDSMVAYAVYGGVALISPDPIGPEAERVEVFAAFRRFAEERGWTLAIIGAGQQWLPVYQGAGLHHIYVGDEGVVNCQTFSLEGGKMKGLRQACTRLARNGYTVEFVDPSTIDPGRVRNIMELIAKLRRGEDERGFSMMLGRLFNPRDKGLLLTIVSDPDGAPAAVCQFVPSPAINGYSLDLMRRDPGEHPNGLIDYALCSTIEHLRKRGGQGLSLNFAAFRSVLDGEKGDGTFTKVERWALKRLSGILPIESLWTFNAKYQPDWLPRYLVYPAFESLVPVVAAVLRAESLTEIPLIGRLLANDPANRPSTVIPEEVLAAARGNG